ncbi:MAG: homocysteine S-methyltransferase family protein [Acidobacteria bacterium]|nr:homocysteine S-methyltransferase family protein [Acidobacteriota bacterium]
MSVPPAPDFRARLRSRPPLVLDAALGTDLLARGALLPAPLWSAQALLDAPELVEAIHRENAEAGADVLTIASFRLHGRNLRGSFCSLSQAAHRNRGGSGAPGRRTAFGSPGLSHLCLTATGLISFRSKKKFSSPSTPRWRRRSPPPASTSSSSRR